MIRVLVSALLLTALPGAAQQPSPVPAPAPQAPASPPPAQARAEPPLYGLEIVARYPHDATAFTQGLLWHDGHLYESVGQPGRSDVRRVSLADGRVLARAALPPAQFGEGLALWRDTLISLTWQHGVAHRWDVRGLRPRGQSRYPGEGWGLATAREGLVLSDGSATLRIVDPATFAERRRVAVTVGGRSLSQLNELEMIDGELYANVWHSRYIVVIDLADGRVTKVIDAHTLIAEVAARDPEAVLNGIAWDAGGRRLFVTGKLWPTLYEVRLTPPR